MFRCFVYTPSPGLRLPPDGHEAAVFISSQSCAKTFWYSQVSPKVVVSLDIIQVMDVVGLSIDDFQGPFWLAKVPGIANRKKPVGQDLVTVGSPVTKLWLNLKRIVHDHPFRIVISEEDNCNNP